LSIATDVMHRGPALPAVDSPLIDVAWGEAAEHALEVRVFRCRQRRHWPAHVHAEHELLWCTAGLVDVEADGRHWRLTSGSVLYLPGRVPHAVAGAAGAEFSCTFLRPPVAPEWRAPTRAVATPLLGELLRYLARVEVDGAARLDAERVVLRVLRPAPDDWSIAKPADERARRVADALIADPADGRTLEAWGRVVGAGARTLTRLFQQELGMSFQDWRTNLRVHVACSLLSSGSSVAAASAAVGFSGPSAFAESFKRVVGRSPREYRRFPPVAVTSRPQ
jgi:AraC-like DNA-binding protein/quercetin dioxygenase-like cupin family protein